MPDTDLQKQEKQAGRDGRGRFRTGCSGNPAGRPPNPSARAAAILLDGEAEALTRKAVELALGGDTAALRLCLDRIVGPRRGRPVAFDLPPLVSAADLAAAMAAIAAAAAGGAITPDEAVALAQMIDIFTRAIEAREAERRHDDLVAYYARSKNPPAVSGG
ncbi:MAG: DUF5681 domain-containing protein [Stellaceae bacterium]